MSVEMVGGTSSGADMEGENVVDMDSVKRKRRKKMKKHKLKKRRKVCLLVLWLSMFRSGKYEKVTDDCRFFCYSSPVPHDSGWASNRVASYHALFRQLMYIYTRPNSLFFFLTSLSTTYGTPYLNEVA